MSRKQSSAFVTTRKGFCYLTVKVGRSNYNIMRIRNYTLEPQDKRDMRRLYPDYLFDWKKIGQQLADERGIRAGGWVRVWSKRGEVKAKALVTKRIKPLICDGKTVHVVGIPLHWGFTGAARKGFGPNSLTPFVGDANVETPEFKAFLVNIEPSTAPVDGRPVA